MKRETPLLFSPAMITAILLDRKTATRRKINKGIHHTDQYLGQHTVEKWDLNGKITSSMLYARFSTGSNTDKTKLIRIPNQPGDIIWARETFSPGTVILDDPKMTYWLFKDGAQMYSNGQYAAAMEGREEGADDFIRWRPSIHMPKDHARIWLECTACYPEKIQSITMEDCVTEGVHYTDEDGWMASEYITGDTPLEAFRSLWYDINSVQDWVENPWVWVRKFKVISKTGKPILKEINE